MFAFATPAALLVFVMTGPPERMLAGSVTLSRGAALVMILIWLGFLLIRFKTHVYLFQWDGDEDLDRSARILSEDDIGQ